VPLTLEQSCIVWADEHWPECHRAMGTHDRRHYQKCLGAVVRKRTQANVRWLWEWIVEDSEQVLRLSPYVGHFVAQGYEITPAHQGWKDYCTMMRALCDGVPLPLDSWRPAETSGPSIKEIDVPAKRSIVRPSTRPGRLSEAARPGLFV